MKVLRNKFLAWLMVAFVAIAAVLTAALEPRSTALAVSSTVKTYEQQNVMDDLKGATIDGKPFDVADYPYRHNDKPRLILFAELCYSYYASKQSDYGLYVYVYNPQQLAFDLKSDRNKVQLRFGDKTSANFGKYRLIYLNSSTEVGSEGRFLKFRVQLTTAERSEIFSALNADERVYELSGFELSCESNVTEYPCPQTYTYKGFAKGYGSDYAETDTLAFSVDDYERVIDFNVHHTVYRPQGDFYQGEQVQLNSCFFRVPNEYFEAYGRLSELMCEWYEYRTKPALVTQDRMIYNVINGLKGQPLSSYSTSNGYLTVQAFGNNDGSWFGEKWQAFDWASNYDMKVKYSGWSGLANWEQYFTESNRFDRFSGVFYSPEDYMNYSVRADVVKDELLSISKALGGEMYGGRYSAALFSDQVDEGHVRGYNPSVVVKADDDQVIWWNCTTKKWWQYIFGGYNVDTQYDSMKAIVTLTEKDLNGSDTAVADTLCISASDVPKLREEYKAAGKTETVVLLRFGTSKYFSAPCAAYYCRESDNTEPKDTIDEWVARRIHWQQSDKDIVSYLAWQTVYLDFDILSLKFTDKDVSFIVPVVSSPTDAIGGISPPLKEDYGDGSIAWWKIVLAAVVLVVVVIIVYKLIKGVLSMIFK
ncbi:MAG: hypothetical protein K2N84_00890 [Clostridia bacterium]|nr:hypothetical protein [Clostridia bacterium]